MPLKVFITRDFEQMSQEAAKLMVDQLAALEQQKDEVVLGLATGNSPTGLYRHLAEAANSGVTDSSRWRTFNLDEYVGLPTAGLSAGQLHPDSYRYFMREHLFKLLEHKPVATFVPPGELVDAPDLLGELDRCPGDWRREGTVHGRAVVIKPEAESKYLRWVRDELLEPYAAEVEAAGGVDLQILGVGGRGHVAFHEAGIPFGLEGLMLVELDIITKEHAVADGNFPSMAECPSHALSMSIDMVFKARSVLVLANGARKTDAISRSMLEAPTPEMPMSYAQIYAEKGGDVVFVVDEDAGRGLLHSRAEMEKRGYEMIDLR